MQLISETIQHGRDAIRLASALGVRDCKGCKYAAQQSEDDNRDAFLLCTNLLCLAEYGARKDAREDGRPFFYCSVERRSGFCGREGKLWKFA